MQENIREIGPSVVFSPPHLGKHAQPGAGQDRGHTRWKQAWYRWALGVGYTMADARFRKQTPGAGLRLRYRLADALVFKMITDKLGLRRTGVATPAALRWGRMSSASSMPWAST
ncbi:MAG: hypothetical protein IPO34_20125 [Dehalococcoidia bacterium]|nr:hypothetical protein [Dehalococcoidia bacterium]